jgi:hypothetical protein
MVHSLHQATLAVISTWRRGIYCGRMTDEPAGAHGAPLERPERHTVLRELERNVDADPARIFPLLVRRIAPTDGYTRFSVYPEYLTAVLQGGWWYRGEYRVTPTTAGAKVSYTVVNVAQGLHLAGGLISKRVVAASPDTFARRMDALEQSLGQG